MDDEPHVPNETMETVTINVMAAPANKDSNSHAAAMEDTVVHIEYPDRTKFVCSMNHEQYDELAEYWYTGY